MTGIQSEEHETPSLPGGTVTLVMTDVEGSSRLWETNHEMASTAMSRRLAIIVEATGRHDGVLPLEQGEGDSSVSVFARASAAAACAADIQRRMAAEVWGSAAPVRVRIAVHSGEAELWPDGTYHGPALNRCARLRSIAHGGQIVVSQATYELLADATDEVRNTTFRDLGVHRLRDLSRPEHVWQLCPAGLETNFLPLASLDVVADTLPVQLNSFVGRDHEVAAVRELLAHHRLVTLTGAGGCGKTRLALEVAADAAGAYPDGLRWVDLAPLADPSLVPAALAAELGMREPPEPVVDTVLRHLASRRTLVALDNCEHLIDACAALAHRIAQGCPYVTVVATSRELLAVEGEVRYPVLPLSLPDGDRVGDSEAVQLFIDRARAARPGFALADDNAAAVAEICRRVDGIPLAIELAAARTRMLSVDQIAAGLGNRFHLLTGNARAALPRQRTLEGSVDWSHDLLSDRERVVFRRLAAFAGTFTLDAAESVCAGGDIVSGELLDVLAALVDRSLVQVVDEAGPHTRYRMLETIRDYARHKLRDAGEAETTRDRHLEYSVSFAARVGAGLEGPDQLRWLTRTDAELDNLRAALDWAASAAAAGHGMRIVGDLTLYWLARSELAIGRTRLEATLRSGDDLNRGSASGALCLLAYRAGDMDAAARFGDEAVAIGRELGDARTLGRALHWRAWAHYWGEGDLGAAWREFAEADSLLREAADDLYLGLNLAVWGFSYIDTSHVPEARALIEEGLSLLPGPGVPRAIAIFSLGWLDSLQGRLLDADVRLAEALQLAQENSDHYIEQLARVILAQSALARGRTAESRQHADLALAMALEHRSPSGEAWARAVIGAVALAEGNSHRAAHELDLAYQCTPMRWFAAICRGFQARIALARLDVDRAAAYADDALRLGRDHDSILAMSFANDAFAALARLANDPRRAEDLLHEQLELATRVGFPYQVCSHLERLAGALVDQGRFEEAARLFGAVHAELERCGYARPPSGERLHEADVAALEESLGPAACDAAWQEGASLSLDDAVAYARRRRGSRKRPAHGWDSLTPTELQVIDLIAEGLTNSGIGERLFVSPRTVQAHLTSVFRKLGVSTRTELAAFTVKHRDARGSSGRP